MEIPNKHSVLKRAIEKYGNVLQIVVAIEELSELQKELCKAIRNGIDQVDRQKLIDEVVEEGAVARSQSDAPEIDGQVFIDGATHLKVGDFVQVEIEEADEYDLWARLI